MIVRPYNRRNLIERCVNRLKQFRRIATCYEKTARACLSMLCIAAARLWIKTVNAAAELNPRSEAFGRLAVTKPDIVTQQAGVTRVCRKAHVQEPNSQVGQFQFQQTDIVRPG